MLRKGSHKYGTFIRAIWFIYHHSLWEALISTLAIIQPAQGNWDSIGFVIISFILIISMWWQYFDNMEKKIDKSLQSSGQIIIYGHLFILMSLSMIAASIRLLFLHEVHYSFILFFTFGSVLLYFLSTTFVFHQYRHVHHRLKIYHLGLFLGILTVFFIINLIIAVPNILIIAELTLFFIIFTKLTISNKKQPLTNEVHPRTQN